jgi:hypothetical protein
VNCSNKRNLNFEVAGEVRAKYLSEKGGSSRRGSSRPLLQVS